MKIAFIGLGAIGLPMARRLSGHPEIELSIFDNRPEVLKAESGLGRVSASVAEVIEGADAVFSVLPADEHVRDVGAQVIESGVNGQIFLDFSTIAPGTIEEVGKASAAKGIVTLGGALTKSVAAAETGDLSIFVGGDEESIARLRPALDRMATDTRAVPTAGSAKALKILNNMCVSSLDLVICDGLLLAAKYGTAPDEMVELLVTSGADGWPVRNHIKKHLLTGDLDPGRFSVAYMGKDAALAAAIALSQSEPAVFAGLVNSAYRGAEAMGFRDHYHPIVMRWFELAASSEPVTPASAPGVAGTVDDPEAAGKVVRAIVAQQALISFDALRLSRLEGVSVDESLAHFESGSADNDFIRDLGGSGSGDSADLDFGTIIDDLAAAQALAAARSVPAMTIAVALHQALSWAGRYGRDRTVAEVLRS